ncbi:MAG: hypothetical protein R3C14_36895 [Caldilineaceae bacterium]
MRISNWATRLNVEVVHCEDRPDNPEGAIVYRLKDLFTTRDGQWDPTDTPGSIEQWARDSYLRPWNAPDVFDDAGGDHNLFARVLDLDGKPITTHDLVIGWSDGLHLLGDPNFPEHIKLTMTPKAKSGWGNQPVWNHFSPERGERGAWAWCPQGAADVVVGGGLPNNLHVSWFAVWQAERREEGGKPDEGEGEGEHPTIGVAPTLAALRQAAWQARGVPLNPESPLLRYARDHQLGAPLTEEMDVGAYRVQGFAQAIVYASQANQAVVEHMAW